METLALYSILCAALYYLGSRAVITSAIWLRYPPWLARFMDCSACSGTWYGGALALTLGRHEDLIVLGFAGDYWLTPIVVALSMMVLTPMVAGLMQHAINVLGVAADLEETE